MQDISHQQAQIFIHTAADTPLRPDDMARLDAHLLGCAECRVFAGKFDQLEFALRTTMRRRWSVLHQPLSIDRILGWQTKGPIRRALSVAAAPTGVATLILLAVTLTRGLVYSGNESAAASATVVVTSAPTPSAQLVRTNTAAAECDFILYTVQEGDTLESISAAYAISEDALIKYNNLESEMLTPSTILMLPLCERQVTSTPTTTLTYTPSIPATSYTP